VDFFRLAAGMAAIAVDNAASYESIEKLVKDRSWFMMKVAHNLRAPLAAVLSILEVVREGYYGPLTAEQDEYLRRIDRRARTMLDMIRELMSLAESRRDQRTVRRDPVTPEFIAGRIQRTFQDKATEKRIAFTLSVAPGLPPMIGDPELIEQMMENLVSNAVKYTPEGGKVGVAFTQSKDNCVCIEVSDNGIGIPKADLPGLFTEFFRADNAKAVEESGTGLGLAIVKEIVDQHGGRIVCESEEGLGTIFCAYMPT
jgi:signal transduction histidine kinase